MCIETTWHLLQLFNLNNRFYCFFLMIYKLFWIELIKFWSSHTGHTASYPLQLIQLCWLIYFGSYRNAACCTHAKTGQNHDLARKLAKLFLWHHTKHLSFGLFYWTTLFCKVMFLTGYSVCQLPHIPKRHCLLSTSSRKFWKRHGSSHSVGITDQYWQEPRALFHFKLLLVEPEWEISWGN